MHPRGIIIFRRKFLSHSAQKIRGHPFKVSENWGIENFYAYWGYQDSPSKISGLTVPKSFVIIPSMSQKNWGIEKFYAY